jgi:hypothetical protein
MKKANTKGGHNRKAILSMEPFTATENGLTEINETMTIAIAAPTAAPQVAPILMVLMVSSD